MIFLVPVSPEVPPRHRPQLWEGLLMIFLLGAVYLYVEPIFDSDQTYIDNLESLIAVADENDNVRDGSEVLANRNLQPNVAVTSGHGALPLADRVTELLGHRPLLKIAPAKGSWDVRRLIYANFLHEGPVHLLLNMIGVFAGMRVLSTFIPFACSLSIFLVGGSLGLLLSILLSTEPSPFIPHLGASAGLFALMGSYYVYNFRYRTRYFFWFPSRKGFISLKTSWFVFLDVLLIELVLSLAQLFPTRVDSVDHIAHVIGFVSGTGLALTLRTFQRWPLFLQIRSEYLFWSSSAPDLNSLEGRFKTWCAVLNINFYNDQVKKTLCELVENHAVHFSPSQLQIVFSYISPTFIRLETRVVGAMLKSLLLTDSKIPRSWLEKTPYDSIIRLALSLTQQGASAAPEKNSAEDNRELVIKFIYAYREAHPEGGDLERKLELLAHKLNGLTSSKTASRGIA